MQISSLRNLFVAVATCPAFLATKSIDRCLPKQVQLLITFFFHLYTYCIYFPQSYCTPLQKKKEKKRRKKRNSDLHKIIKTGLTVMHLHTEVKSSLALSSLLHIAVSSPFNLWSLLCSYTCISSSSYGNFMVIKDLSFHLHVIEYWSWVLIWGRYALGFYYGSVAVNIMRILFRMHWPFLFCETNTTP